MIDGDDGETMMELVAARRLAVDLMRRHGLTRWRLVFDNAKTRAGICRALEREIGLSRVLTHLHGEAEVRDTVLHEIAHALVGPGHGHDAVWRARALEIGCSAQRCVSTESARADGPWVGLCSDGHRTTRHRQPIRVQSCGQCSRTFDPLRLLDWTYQGHEVQMHPRYQAERRRITQGLGEAAGSGASSTSTGSGRRAVEGRPSAAAARSGRADTPAAHEPAAGLLTPGSRVRLTGRGKYAGRVGRVVKVGRTRYHVRCGQLVLTAPFALIEPC